MPLSLRTKKPVAQRVDRADHAQIVLQLAGLDAVDRPPSMLAMPRSTSPRPTIGIITDLAGGRLHQRVEPALFLQHLGDGGRWPCG